MLNLTSKLAFSNLVKNRQLYYPYALATFISVAILYIFSSLFANPNLDQVYSANNVKMVLGLGIPIVTLTVVVIIFYANSFVMKNRSKEIGLYGILGLERRHMSLMLGFESIYFSLISISLGIVTGVVFDQLLYGLLLKTIQAQVVLASTFQWRVVFLTILLFLAVFFLLWLLNSIRVFRYGALQLVKEKNSGEKKTRLPMVQTILGLLSLGAGYTIALSVKHPASALVYFFLAVLLVIAGTYLLFNAGITTFLHLLKKNKGYYYKPNNFISLSNLIFRMKRNAAGLATISILSTMVLVTLVGGINLYVGQNDYIEKANPYSYNLLVSNRQEPVDMAVANQNMEEFQKKVGITDGQQVSYQYIMVNAQSFENQTFQFSKDAHQVGLAIYSRAEYEKMSGKTLNVTDNQVAIFSKNLPFSKGDQFSLANQKLIVAEVLDKDFTLYKTPSYLQNLLPQFVILVVDNPTIIITQLQEQGIPFTYQGFVGLNTNISESKQVDYMKEWDFTQLASMSNENNRQIIAPSSQAEDKLNARTFMGSLFFIGIFLALVFMLGAVLVIYYKQISEGYEDRDRFAILQKVGLSEKQSKQVIRKQVLTVFFLPLLTCFLHLAFAYHMLSLILQVLGAINADLLLQMTGLICLLFALLYITVFALTSRSYRKIVWE